LSEYRNEIEKTLASIKEKRYLGYDPYDCLKSPITRKIPGKYPKIALTQLNVYSPVNLRPLLRIERGINPKGMGLYLSSLVKLYEIVGPEEKQNLKMEMEKVVNWLLTHSSEGFSGLCWGYNYDWQDLSKLIPEGQPSIVVSSFIGHSLLDYHELTGDGSIIEKVGSIRDFILGDINRYEDDDGICFSYSPYDNTKVHNANLLGASILFRIGRKEDNALRELALRSYNFSLNKQAADGSWPYSDERGFFGGQIDFHQGFVLDTLMYLMDDPEGKKIAKEALDKGLKFYERQFKNNGASYWRYPRKWPVDIHHQAQGIITFSKASVLDGRYLKYAKRIAEWTLQNLYDGKGNFYYQKWPFLTNRITHIRWGQMWMLLALATLRRAIIEDK